MTMEAESAPVTKKIATRTMARMDTAPAAAWRHRQVVQEVEQRAVEGDRRDAVDHGGDAGGRVVGCVGFGLDVDGGAAKDARTRSG